MNPLQKRRLGRTHLELPVLGLGTAPLGNLFEHRSGSEARRILQTAWDGGIRYFDTAPYYGHGRSEHRVGNFLQDQSRNTFVISTKIGRVLQRTDVNPDNYRTDNWAGPLPFQLRHDYSYDGVMRSYEDSTHRLGLNRIDVLLIHDLDPWFFPDPGDLDARIREMESGFKALDELRSSGEIGAIGSGINCEEMMPRLLAHFDLDCFLVAMEYTLLDQNTLDEHFPECEKRGVGVIIGAPYASGILATGAVPGAKYKYKEASDEVLEKVRRIERVGKRHDVDLLSAAVQFPLGHPVVTSVIPGALEPSHVETTIHALQQSIPADYWKELKQERLIREDAPEPK